MIILLLFTGIKNTKGRSFKGRNRRNVNLLLNTILHPSQQNIIDPHLHGRESAIFLLSDRLVKNLFYFHLIYKYGHLSPLLFTFCILDVNTLIHV